MEWEWIKKIKIGKKHFIIGGVVIAGITLSILIGFLWGRKNMVSKYDCLTVDALNELKLYYGTEDRNIYTYGIDNIDYDDMELKDSEDIFETIEYYKKKFWRVANMRGKEVAVYENEDMAMLVCNTKEGNRDVYFGELGLYKRIGFCTTRSGEFVQTFHIKHVEKAKNDKYIYITIKRSAEEEVKTFRIESKLAPNIKAGEVYEFTFKYTNIDIDDDMESIFSGAVLLKMTKTTSKGLNERNDVING